MNLQELHESKKTKVVTRALREHYDLNIDFESMNLQQTQKMLSKVRGLLKEARAKKQIYESQNNPAYLKLLMMDQALSEHFSELQKQVQIVVENEEVQEAQVLLAAQDLVDSLQKMLEQVSKMNVEELNAVSQGIKNEFGEEKGTQYNQTVSASLTTLQQALQTAKGDLERAQSSINGADMSAEMPLDNVDGAPGGELDAEPAPDMAEPGADVAPEMPEEEPELDVGMAAGRERR